MTQTVTLLRGYEGFEGTWCCPSPKRLYCSTKLYKYAAKNNLDIFTKTYSLTMYNFALTEVFSLTHRLDSVYTLGWHMLASKFDDLCSLLAGLPPVITFNMTVNSYLYAGIRELPLDIHALLLLFIVEHLHG
jgi:hypothetical protein